MSRARTSIRGRFSMTSPHRCRRSKRTVITASETMISTMAVTTAEVAGRGPPRLHAAQTARDSDEDAEHRGLDEAGHEVVQRDRMHAVLVVLEATEVQQGRAHGRAAEHAEQIG